MHLPAHFVETRTEEAHRIIKDNALGMLVRATPEGLEVDHFPFVLLPEEGSHGVLLAHVARDNPICSSIRTGELAMVVFRGAQGYISPSWYPGKHETHRRVPTWNYEVVHVRGTLHVLDDERFVRGVVARLTRQHEASQAAPWKMGDAPADYIAQELALVVGIELRITEVVCKRKLSQHHLARDREGAIQGLKASGEHALAQVMRETAQQGS
jgi:transcriptional regulator